MNDRNASRRRVTVAALATLIAMGLCSLSRGGGPVENWKERADRFAKPLIESKDGVNGLVIGILTPDGRREFYGYGKTGAGSPSPTKDTLFDIGSVTKIFTTLALARMIENKELKLDDPVRVCLPPSMIVPRHGDHEITPAELATHTSGLPALPPNLMMSLLFQSVFGAIVKSADPMANPYANFGSADLTKGLAEIKLPTKAKLQFAYSNFGVGLLGYALARKAGSSYDQLVRTRITSPLGMQSTMQTPSAAERGRLAIGHHKKSEAVGRWTFDALAGCGCLCSTADDLLRLLEAECGRTDTPLARAMQMTQQEQFRLSPTAGIGLGWLFLDAPGGRRVFWHNGATNGYRSFAAFSRKPRAAIVVLCNNGPFSAADKMDAFGINLMKNLDSDHPPQVAPAGGGRRKPTAHVKK